MASEKYHKEAENLIKAIDIAIEIFRNHSPKEWYEHKVGDINQVEHTIKCYKDMKQQRINAEAKYQNLASLKYCVEDVFIYFQEASGETVNEFWKKIKEANLPYERENKMGKILKRKKIRNDIEYDYVIDTIVPLEQEGVLTKEDVELLNQMIGQYEQ